MVHLGGKNGVVVLIIFLFHYHDECGATVANHSVAEKKVEYIRMPLLVTVDRRHHDSKQRLLPSPPMSTTSSPSQVQLAKREQLIKPGKKVQQVLLRGVESSTSSTPGETLIQTMNTKNSNNTENITDVADGITAGDTSEQDDDEEDDEEDDKEDEVDDERLEKDGVKQGEIAKEDINEDENGDETKDEEEEDDEDNFNELDLMELVEDLEHEADLQEQTNMFPEILDIIHGKNKPGKNHTRFTTKTPRLTTNNTTAEDKKDGISNVTLLHKTGLISRSDDDNDSVKISLNEDGELELSSDDFSGYSQEIADGISEGVEEFLRMSDGVEIDDDSKSGENFTTETRQFSSVYLFQGQYYAEPRLNRFIDGALRNMGTEMRLALMDPLFFRVLPKGQVVERDRPLMKVAKLTNNGVGPHRPFPEGVSDESIVVGRQLSSFFRLPNRKNKKQQQKKVKKQQGNRKKPFLQFQRGKNKWVTGGFTKNKKVNQKNRQQQLQRERQRRQRLKQQRQRNRVKKQQHLRNKNKGKKKANGKKTPKRRIRRKIRKDVGGGRIEGLSRVQRDGDAEMQSFGSYTLIRSHMKIGPVKISMQFRTKKGIRRSGATLPVIRAHTVTRVSCEGSEMIVYLLDSLNPESIRVRGKLFPAAQRVAKNVFARLFLPKSFLVSKLKEKAALAYLSKAVIAKNGEFSNLAKPQQEFV